MNEAREENYTASLIESVLAALSGQDNDAVFEILLPLHPSDIAIILESAPQDARLTLWGLIKEEDTRSSILTYLNPDALLSVVENLDQVERADLTSNMEIDDLVEVVENLPEDVSQEFVSELNEGVQEQLVNSLTYEEETAGRLMASDVVSIRQDVNIEVVLRFLRMRKQLPEHTDQLMIVDSTGHLQGSLSIESLLTAQPDDPVTAHLKTEVDVIPVTMTDKDVAEIFEKHDLVSAPVIDDDGVLLGRITIDDVLDIIREKADAQLLNMSGLDEDSDLFAPVMQSTRGRTIWLGINLLTAFLASWVIGLFQETLDKVVALAVLMPIVASMGGIAGSQTLTLTIRGLALNQVVKSNLPWLTRKEFMIGIINGVLWSVVVAILAFLWFEESRISLIIGAAVIINLLAAALAGIMIPVILNRFGQDPALSGSVVLTTVTDVVGFMSFLGLATIFLV